MKIKEIERWAVLVVTFPGVIFRVYVRIMMCAATGLNVTEKHNLHRDYPAGYVKHGRIQRFRTSFLVSIMPFILATVGAVGFSLPVVLTTQYVPGSGYVGYGPLSYLLQWLSMSLAFYAIPYSRSDMRSLWELTSQSWGSSISVTLVSPIVVSVYALHITASYMSIIRFPVGSMFSARVFYSLGVHAALMVLL